MRSSPLNHVEMYDNLTRALFQVCNSRQRRGHFLRCGLVGFPDAKNIILRIDCIEV